MLWETNCSAVAQFHHYTRGWNCVSPRLGQIKIIQENKGLLPWQGGNVFQRETAYRLTYLFSDVKSYACLKMEFPWGLNGPQAVSACVKDDWCLNLTCTFCCTCLSISNICLKIHRLFPHSYCIGCVFSTFKTSSQSPEIADSKRRAAVPWDLTYMIKHRFTL